MNIVDCHRHLGGSISVDFVWDVVEKGGDFWMGETRDDLARTMQCMPDEPREFKRFLDKFEPLNHIEWTEELIDKSIEQACADLTAEGVDFCWMHFSINKYLTHLKWHRKDAIKFVCDAFERHAPGVVGPILCLKYESTRASQRQIARLIDEPVVQEMVHGIDLVGDEGYYDASFYGPILRPWKDAGKILFAHVGESRSAKNIGTAIEYIGVTEICHGIKLFEQPGLLGLAKDHDVCFHMALTSNELTGVTTEDHHPIVAFIDEGLQVTIGTDDPVQCNTTMNKEYDKLRYHLWNYEEDEVERYVDIIRKEAVNRVLKANA